MVVLSAQIIAHSLPVARAMAYIGAYVRTHTHETHVHTHALTCVYPSLFPLTPEEDDIARFFSIYVCLY